MFSDSLNYLNFFSEIDFIFFVSLKRFAALDANLARPLTGAGGRVARVLGVSLQCWKRFSEIAFAFCSYPAKRFEAHDVNANAYLWARVGELQVFFRSARNV